MSNKGGDIPQHIMVDNILSRLPAKSLCRFKCVSKPWRALLSEPHFLKTQHTLDSLILVSTSGSLFSLHFDESLTATATKLAVPSAEHPIEWVHVLGSCNGLLLLSDKSKSKFILNPSTRLCKKIPGTSFLDDECKNVVMYGFGYDPSTDDYKVVIISHYLVHLLDEDYGGPDVYETDVEVCRLKSNFFWRNVKNYPYDSCCFKNSQLVFVNGSLHWITFYDLGPNVIAAFDLADENFRDLPPPRSLGNCEMGSYDLTVLGGCLCMYRHLRNSEEISVWVMKEYGVVESWTEFKIMKPNNVSRIVPMCMLSDEEVLLEMDRCKLTAYNPEEGRGRDLVVHGFSGSIKACATYVDSLVSPNCNNGVGRQDEAFRRIPNMVLLRIRQEIFGFLDGMSYVSLAKEGTYKAGSTSSANIIEASSSVTDPLSMLSGLDCLIDMDVPEGQTYEEEDPEDV